MSQSSSGGDPSFVSKNVRGISAAREFNRLLTHARAQFIKNPNLHAIMIQETNVRGREKIEEYKKSAARLKILMVGGHIVTYQKTRPTERGAVQQS